MSRDARANLVWECLPYWCKKTVFMEVKTVLYLGLIGLLVFSSPVLASQTLTVPDDYSTIQAAIDAAQPGDTVYIRAGRYRENLIIEKPLHLVGEDRTQVIIRSSDPEEDVVILRLDTGEALLEGIAVTGGVTGFGVIVGAGAKATLRGVTAIGNRYGIVTLGEGEVTIEYTYLINSEKIGLQLENAKSHIQGNEILEVGIGLLLVGDIETQLSENLVGLCQWGIDTYTTQCGWTEGTEIFSGTVSGQENRVYGKGAHLCPSYPGEPWPQGFIDLEWTEAIEKAVEGYNRGYERYRSQDFQGAKIAYEAGLAVLEEAPFGLLEAGFNQNIGNVYRHLARYEEALSAYQSARAVFVEHAMDVNVAKVDVNIGNAYRDLGRYEEGLAAYQSARAVYVERAMDVDVAKVDQNIGNVYRHLARYEEALSAYQSARAVYVERAMDVDVANVDVDTGNVYDDLGRYEEALATYQSARAVYVERAMDVNVAKVDGNIGNAYSELGRYEEALATYQSARAVYRERAMDVDVAKVDQNIGVVYSELGRYEEALATYQSARAVYVERAMDVNVAKVDQNIGIVYAHLGRYEEGLAAYQSARAVYVERAMDVNVADVDVNIGVVDSELGRYEEALDAYQSARVVYVERAMDVDVADVDVNIGNVYSELGRYEEALSAYQSARAVYLERAMDVNVAKVDGNIGVVYSELGRYEEALAAYGNALDILDGIPPAAGMLYSHPATRWMVLSNMGVCHEGLKQWEEARVSYVAAVAVIESIRGYLKAETVKLAWQERTEDVYERLIDLLYRMGEGKAALSYAERSRARTFLDLLALGPVGTLENIAEAGIKTGVVEPDIIEADLQHVIGQLPEGVAALEYFVTDEATYLWVIKKEDVEGPVRIPHGRLDLMKKVIACRQAVERREEAANYYLALLYDWLIRPVEHLLTQGSKDEVPHLVVIPSGPLYYLPFQALLWKSEDREKQARLIEHYTLSYSPSLVTLKYATKAVEPARKEAMFLALADPDPGDPTTPRLPEAQTEVKRIAELFPNAEVYVDREATEPVVHSRSHVTTVLLFSTHGIFNPHNPMFSYLLLSPTEESDGRLHTYEVFALPLDADMVTLSACETLLPSLEEAKALQRAIRNLPEDNEIELTHDQLATLTAGDEIVGLTRAFIFAGSPSVLSSLWSVYSEATADLMVAFHRYLQEGMSKAEALRQAQLDLLSEAPHPVFWAAFNLMGDWK